MSELNQEIDRYKKVVLMSLLKLTSIAGIIFPIINFQRGLYLFSLIETITIAITISMYFGVKSTKNQNKIDKYAMAYTVLFFSVMMLAFSTKGISNSMFIWAFTIPMISYLLLGIRKGFLVTLIFYLISIILLFQKFNHYELTLITKANIFITAIGFWVMSHIYEKANFLTKQKLNQMAIYDKLTGLHNRTMLNQIFLKHVDDARIKNQKICLIAFDLDLFKDINDNHGHIFGDEVLIEFSKILKSNVPENGSAFRLGGEEFAVVYPCQSKKNAIELAEKIRQLTENIQLKNESKLIGVTVSAGVAIDKPKNVSFTNILKLSDNRLYQAKALGRNQVIYNDSKKS
ncbi:MAG: GGDEF domain-containing protein [Marinicellaceae bacterium]